MVTTQTNGTRVGLGLLSLGLGAAPLVAPGAVARLAGLSARPRTRGVLRAIGVRELVVGTGLLLRREPAWLWARVAQDVIDVPLATVVARRRSGEDRARLAGVTGFLVGLTVVDLAAALQATRASEGVATR